MDAISIDVLGTPYKIIESDRSTHPILDDQCLGFCDHTIKTIVIDDCIKKKQERDALKNLDYLKLKTKRHELIHAFLFESGLACNSDWAQNEEMVDWIAYQFPKLLTAFQEAGCI